MLSRTTLVAAIAAYHSPYSEELAFRERFLELLDHPRAFFRDHLPGHITASAWITDDTGTHAFLTHHAKLDRWLQPGGHADGEEDVIAVAQREALEETGLRSLRLARTAIFDLDIHPIPARNGFPEHLHYDVRFHLVARMDEAFIVSAESKDLAWIHGDDIARITGNNRSMLRMLEKGLSASGS